MREHRSHGGQTFAIGASSDWLDRVIELDLLEVKVVRSEPALISEGGHDVSNGDGLVEEEL